MLTQEDEELEKRKERARQLRNSVGMITNNDIEKNATSIKDNLKNNLSNSGISLSDTSLDNLSKGMLNISNEYQNVDSEYQQRLNRAKELRNSIGMITSKDKEYNQDEREKRIEEKMNKLWVDTVSNDENINNNIQSSQLTEEERKQLEEANSDTNLFSQIGKTVENAWVGAVKGITEFFKTTTDSDRVPKPSLNGQIQSINKNTPKEVVMAYQAEQQNENNPITENNLTNNRTITDTNHKNALVGLLNVISEPILPAINSDSKREQQITENTSIENNLSTKNNLRNNLPTINLDSERQQQSTGNKPILFNLDVNNTTSESLNNYKDAYGELELNAVQRDLTKATKEQQEKIASNTNKISNPLLKKVSSLLPSMSNSLVGAGLSAVHPGLRNELFYAKCSWKL